MEQVETAVKDKEVIVRKLNNNSENSDPNSGPENGRSEKMKQEKKAVEVKKADMFSDDLTAQKDYVKKLEEQKFDFGLVFENAFVRGMRDIGYKSTATALHELIDNSIQADANNVHVFMGYDKNNKSKKKPDMIAVADDGHGMVPTMIRASVLWGGSHRADQGDRTGFGRYGYGLPSACVSMGEVYTVYSKTSEGEWQAVEINLPKIGRGECRNENGHVVAPLPEKKLPPKWVMEQFESSMPGAKSGSVVVIESIDRLSFNTTQRLKAFFLQTFGVTYMNYLREISLYVDGTKVEPIDPLFITEGHRYYALDSDRAEALEPMFIPIKHRDTKEPVGDIKVRFSYMPPTFQRLDKGKEVGSRHQNANDRFHIMKDYNGIKVLRAGRLIDVVTSKCPWTTFQNYDRNIGIEIDFPPTLDEEFSITTSKQQVVLSHRIWDILKENGVFEALEQMRKRQKLDIKALKDKGDADEEEGRPSEHAMEDVQSLLTGRKTPSPEDKKKSEEALEREAEEKAKKAGIPAETVKKEMEKDAEKRPFKVSYVNHPGAPFYGISQVGGQRVLSINRAHRFYSEVYAGEGSTHHSRYGLEVLMFVLGDCELRANEEIRQFYEAERAEWSKYLGLALGKLSQWENQDDMMAAEMEQKETSEA